MGVIAREDLLKSISGGMMGVFVGFVIGMFIGVIIGATARHVVYKGMPDDAASKP